MIRWVEGIDLDHVTTVRQALDELTAEVPQLRSCVHGSDVGVGDANFDYVIITDYDSVADWRAARDHPAFVLFNEECLTGRVAERATVQFQTGSPSRSAHDVAAEAMARLLAEPDDF